MSGPGPLETANLERIEVLKGLASILFGRIEPGGLINLVPKQPLATPHYALQQQFGSFNLYRTTADATGPLTKEGNLLYRVNLAYENGGSFVDFLSNERVFFAPTVRWNLSSRTQATVELQYKLSRDPRYAGIPAIGNRLPGLPRHTNLGEPFNRVTSDDTLFSFDWSHAFNASWTLKQRFYANWTNGRERLVQPSFMDVDERTLIRNFFGAQQIKESWYGFYVQDQIRLPYHLHLLAGFRYDNVDYRLPTQTFAAPGDPIPASAETFTAKDQAIKPRVGLLWQPIPELSVYGNYVENFGGRITARGVNNVQLAPQSAQQWEVGIKTELLDKRVTGSLAWFDLTKRNLTTQDPFNPAFSLVTGEVRNRGLELDLAGEVLPGWRLIGVYSYIDSEITSDTIDTAGNPVGNQGNRLFNVPRHGGSVWSMYEFQEGPFRGVKFGGGLVARSAREGDNQNSYQLPGYVIGNLLLGYERRVGGLNVITQLNIENLTDQPYFAGSQGFSAVNAYGMPRAFFGSIRLEY
ncbi:MAG: TonB-dependent siderophore receptor [Nitrospiraceae bacterium]